MKKIDITLSDGLFRKIKKDAETKKVKYQVVILGIIEEHYRNINGVG